MESVSPPVKRRPGRPAKPAPEFEEAYKELPNMDPASARRLYLRNYWARHRDELLAKKRARYAANHQPQPAA
jgi:hypothetical protein